MGSGVRSGVLGSGCRASTTASSPGWFPALGFRRCWSGVMDREPALPLLVSTRGAGGEVIGWPGLGPVWSFCPRYVASTSLASFRGSVTQPAVLDGPASWRYHRFLGRVRVWNTQPCRRCSNSLSSSRTRVSASSARASRSSYLTMCRPVSESCQPSWPWSHRIRRLSTLL